MNRQVNAVRDEIISPLHQHLASHPKILARGLEGTDATDFNEIAAELSIN